MDLVQAYLPDILALVQCADDPQMRAPVRAAAILMATLHPRGGLHFALDRQAFLVAHAEAPDGSSLAMAVGLCVDIYAAENQLSVRVMLSALVEATRAHYSEHRTFRTLLDRWLSRSSTPATHADVLNKWLQLPQLATQDKSDASAQLERSTITFNKRR